MISENSGIAGRNRAAGPRISSRQVWDAVGRTTFCVLSQVTPAVAPDSWKARHIGGGEGWSGSGVCPVR